MQVYHIQYGNNYLCFNINFKVRVPINYFDVIKIWKIKTLIIESQIMY